MAQASYGQIGHVSRYVVPGSKRVAWTLSSAPAGLEASAFVLPDGAGVVAVLLNSGNSSLTLTIQDAVSMMAGNVTVPANSAQTLRYSFSS